jgi:hypothetical protein
VEAQTAQREQWAQAQAAANRAQQAEDERSALQQARGSAAQRM